MRKGIYHHTEETKMKISLALKGKPKSIEACLHMSQPRTGEARQHMRQPKTAEHRQHMSEAIKGKPRPYRIKCRQLSFNLLPYGLGRRHHKETKLQIAQSMRAFIDDLSPEEQFERARKWIRAAGLQPNKEEQLLDNILQEHFPGQWRYVGKGDFSIGGKIPDFINVNGKKQLIELFGEWWHKATDAPKRVNQFAQFGFNTLIIWASELKSENLVVDKVRSFSGF